MSFGVIFASSMFMRDTLPYLQRASIKLLLLALFLGAIFFSLAYSEREVSLVIMGLAVIGVFVYYYIRSRAAHLTRSQRPR